MAAQLIIDATHLKVAPQLAYPKKRCSRRIGRTKGGLNSKLNAVCAGEGWPLI